MDHVTYLVHVNVELVDRVIEFLPRHLEASSGVSAIHEHLVAPDEQTAQAVEDFADHLESAELAEGCARPLQVLKNAVKCAVLWTPPQLHHEDSLRRDPTYRAGEIAGLVVRSIGLVDRDLRGRGRGVSPPLYVLSLVAAKPELNG